MERSVYFLYIVESCFFGVFSMIVFVLALLLIRAEKFYPHQTKVLQFSFHRGLLFMSAVYLVYSFDLQGASGVYPFWMLYFWQDLGIHCAFFCAMVQLDVVSNILLLRGGILSSSNTPQMNLKSKQVAIATACILDTVIGGGSFAISLHLDSRLPRLVWILYLSLGCSILFYYSGQSLMIVQESYNRNAQAMSPRASSNRVKAINTIKTTFGLAFIGGVACFINAFAIIQGGISLQDSIKAHSEYFVPNWNTVFVALLMICAINISWIPITQAHHLQPLQSDSERARLLRYKSKQSDFGPASMDR